MIVKLMKDVKIEKSDLEMEDDCIVNCQLFIIMVILIWILMGVIKIMLILEEMVK